MTEKPGPLDKQIGARLKMAREEAELSLTELAAETGLSEERLAALEAGNAICYANDMVLLCDALDVDPNYFFGWGLC